ncbi:hypothetical protein LINPERHAP1_LOCUS4668 [Linum perenne]
MSTGSLSRDGRGLIGSSTSYGWWHMTDCLRMMSSGSRRGMMTDCVRDVDILRRQSCMCCETVPPRMSHGCRHHRSGLLSPLMAPLFLRPDGQLQEACSVMLMAAA